MVTKNDLRKVVRFTAKGTEVFGLLESIDTVEASAKYPDGQVAFVELQDEGREFVYEPVAPHLVVLA